MLFLSDIKRIVSEAINPRLNDDESKSLNRVIIDLVNSHIGQTDNSGGSNSSGTVFAKLNRLMSDSLSYTNTIMGHITNHFNDIKNYLASGKLPSVKSVQRGDIYKWSDSDLYTDISISTVNVQKSFILVQGNAIYGDSGVSYGARGQIIESNKIRIFSYTMDGSVTNHIRNLSWQVVEYF